VPWDRTAELEAYFREQGAAVELFAHDGGHQLQRGELEASARFLTQ